MSRSSSRRLLRALSIAAMLYWAHGALAAYPEKPVRMILPNAAGAATDTVARIFTTKLSEVMGQQFIVDNGAVPNILVVHASVPARTLPEFVQHTKKNPGKMRYGSPGIGFTPHLTMELFKSVAGIDLQHIPYKSGAQAITELLGGQIHAQFNNLPSQLPNLKSGKIHGVAVTSAKRSAQLPDVPTVSESGYPGFEVTVWYGLCAPAKTPRAVLAILQNGVVKAIAAPDLRNRFADQGVEPRAVTGTAFDAFYKAEVSRWAKVVKEAGITPD